MTPLPLIHAFAQATPCHLTGLTLIPRRHFSFMNAQDARRYPPLRSAPQIGYIEKENRIPNLNVGALGGPILRRKASKLAICHVLQGSSARHHTKFPLLNGLPRYQGVLLREHILILATPSIEAHLVGPKNKPKGRITTR